MPPKSRAVAVAGAVTPLLCVAHEYHLRGCEMIAFVLAALVSQTTVITAARMFDSKKRVIVANPQLIIHNGVLVPGPAPSGATVIALGDVTLMPGMLDAHTHLSHESSLDWKQDLIDSYAQTVPEMALHASVFAKRTLFAGFTTVRELGSLSFIDIGLREAAAKGHILGPTVIAATDPIGTTGGHCDEGGFREGVFREERAPGVADSPDGLRAIVRRNVKFGADVIKVCGTGGVLSLADDVQAAQVTQAEIDAIVDEAHMRGKKVAVHAHGAEGAKRAIRAGADSIEHGTFLDDEALTLMKKKGTWLVPTMMGFTGVRNRLERNALAPAVIPKARAALKSAGDVVRKAIAMKLNIALGTDAGVYPHGQNGGELRLLVEAGMTPVEALATATIRTAELLGVDDRAGSLDVGKWADVIAVSGDPTQDVRTVENVRFVMKRGTVAVDRLTR